MELMEAVRVSVLKKFEELQRRTLSVIGQLTEIDLNWRPNASSNSISNLVIHIQGNVNERIVNGILGRAMVRNRDEEFASIPKK